MDLNRDAMLVGLHIAAWSGRLYDRQASDHVAVAHEASTGAGRYNKRLLPKAAFAALTSTMSEARTKHYENSLPWDDKGARLLTVANYEHYTELMNALRERVVRQRARFIEDYDDYVDQARLDLGKLFRIEDYPSKEALQGKFAIRYRITPVPDADHFIAKLASDDTERVKRDIERHIEELREVATEIKPESVVVLQVDAIVQDAAEYPPDDLPEEIVVKGRGGTDFRPGFEWLDEQGIRPAVCLYFTDMECSDYPDAEPGFPVAWVNWGPAPEDWNREPWGERIDIAPGRGARP